jgi:hypothetical protein
LKLKIPSISLRNQEEWGGYTTLYGVDRVTRPRDQDETYQKLQRLPQGKPGQEFMRISRHTPEATPGRSTARQPTEQNLSAAGPSNDYVFMFEHTPGTTPGPSTVRQPMQESTSGPSNDYIYIDDSTSEATPGPSNEG